MCEREESKEVDELLEEVPLRFSSVEGRLGLESMFLSDSPESEESSACDFGGDGASPAKLTRSYALRVRRTGPPLSAFLDCPVGVVGSCSFVFLGRVRAQFSHGMARFRSFSSYVFLKLESRRCKFESWPLCKARILGLSGGVSRGEVVGPILKFWSCSSAPRSPLSLSEDWESAGDQGGAVEAVILSDRVKDRVLVLCLLVLRSSLSSA